MEETYAPSPSELLSPSEAFAFLRQKKSLNSPSFGDVTNTQDASKEFKEEVIHKFFGVNYENFGVLFDDNLSKELVEYDEIRSIPNSPSWLAGFTNVRGNIVPIIDLVRYFKIENHDASNQLNKKYLLTIGKGSRMFALQMLQLPEKLVFDVEPDSFENRLAPEALKPFIQGTFKTDIPWFQINHYDFLVNLKSQR